MEEKIEQLESRIEEINQLFTDETVFSNSLRCQELHREQDDLQVRLDEAMTAWEELA